MDYGYLTLVAPILTLAVAIATRKVPLAMLVGIFTGQLIICGWNPFTAINESVNGILSVCADTGNLKTFLFTALMGAFVILVRISGGVKGFVNYLTEQSKRVKSPRMAMLIAYVIGIIIFIDGLLSIMFTGVVTRPLIDKFKVSREKLAYICDATSAPVNAIIPPELLGCYADGPDLRGDCLRIHPGRAYESADPEPPLPVLQHPLPAVRAVLYYHRERLGPHEKGRAAGSEHRQAV